MVDEVKIEVFAARDQAERIAGGHGPDWGSSRLKYLFAGTMR